MTDLEVLNRRYESSLRAKAFVAAAVGKALDRTFGSLPGGWVTHVERACGRAMAAEIREKGTVPAGTLGHAVWGGPLTDMQLFSSAFLELVRPFTVVDRLVGLLRAPMNTLIPKQTPDDDPMCDWVGENAPTPAAQFSFEQAVLPPAKIAKVFPFTKELALRADMQNIIERRLVRGLVRGTDFNFLDPAVGPVANVNPASITYGATEVVSTGATAAAVEADVTDALGQLSGGIASRAFVVVSPGTAMYMAKLRISGSRVFPNIGYTGGDVLGVPVLISLEAGNYFIALDAAGIVVADGGIEIDVAEQASIQQSDTPSAGPTNTVSLFQAGAIALKVVRWISWARRDGAAVFIDFPFGSPGSPA